RLADAGGEGDAGGHRLQPDRGRCRGLVADRSWRRRPPDPPRGGPGADDLRRVAVYFGDDRLGSAPALARLARQSMSPGNKGDTKFIFVTGGVVSALGKGITAASIGRLLVSRGYRVQLQKFDPYISVDPGTMSPFQHGEVFVTEDGAETDLDLGHYERFTDENTKRTSNVTAG